MVRKRKKRSHACNDAELGVDRADLKQKRHDRHSPTEQMRHQRTNQSRSCDTERSSDNGYQSRHKRRHRRDGREILKQRKDDVARKQSREHSPQLHVPLVFDKDEATETTCRSNDPHSRL